VDLGAVDADQYTVWQRRPAGTCSSAVGTDWILFHELLEMLVRALVIHASLCGGLVSFPSCEGFEVVLLNWERSNNYEKSL
jgi:hypothetical protein